MIRAFGAPRFAGALSMLHDGNPKRPNSRQVFNLRAAGTQLSATKSKTLHTIRRLAYCKLKKSSDF